MLRRSLTQRFALPVLASLTLVACQKAPDTTQVAPLPNGPPFRPAATGAWQPGATTGSTDFRGDPPVERFPALETRRQ